MGPKQAKYVALIPARGGSESIPKKNIRPLLGRPLLYWACKAAEECPRIEAVYVSTDSDEIGAVAEGLGLGKLKVIDRDPSTATSAASTESALLDFAQRADFENVFLIQATSPLITGPDLERAIDRFESGDCDSVLSIVRQKRFLWTEANEHTVEPANYDPAHRPRRQEQSGFLVENGALYLTSRELLLRDQCRLSGRIGYVEMPADSYIELDEPGDWEIVEGLLLRRERNSRGALNERIRKVRFIATDVDGVLTDSGMYYCKDGDESKKFNTRDGKGFELLRQNGFITGIITGETTQIVERRAKKLKIDELRQGASDKVAAMKEILERRSLSWDEVGYIGDDDGDYELLKRVGVSAAPSDASLRIRRAVDLTLRSAGGDGALREFADWAIEATR